MKPKATNKGTCQVCGRVQKLPNGLLSTHGYTVNCGFFAGICHGTGYLPFEQAKDLVEGSIKRAQQLKEQVQLQQAELRAPVAPGTTCAWVNIYFPYRSKYLPAGHKWCIVKITGDSKAGYHYQLQEGQLNLGHHNREIARYAYPKPATMEDAIKIANSLRADYMQTEVTQISTYIRWQQERVENWTPMPLLPL